MEDMTDEDKASSEAEYTGTALSPRKEVKLNFINAKEHERDLVEVAKLDRAGKLDHLKPKSAKKRGSRSACGVS